MNRCCPISHGLPLLSSEVFNLFCCKSSPFVLSDNRPLSRRQYQRNPDYSSSNFAVDQLCVQTMNDRGRPSKIPELIFNLQPACDKITVRLKAIKTVGDTTLDDIWKNVGAFDYRKMLGGRNSGPGPIFGRPDRSQSVNPLLVGGLSQRGGFGIEATSFVRQNPSEEHKQDICDTEIKEAIKPAQILLIRVFLVFRCFAIVCYGSRTGGRSGNITVWAGLLAIIFGWGLTRMNCLARTGCASR